MAYIPEEVIEQFHFETGFNKTFKPVMDAYLQKRGKKRSKDSSIASAKSGGLLQVKDAPQENKLVSMLSKKIL